MTIPCVKCKQHSSKMLSTRLSISPSKSEMVKFIIDLHNDVNMRNDKPKTNIDDAIQL